MQEETPKTKLSWNKMLLAVIVVIAALAALVVVLEEKKASDEAEAAAMPAVIEDITSYTTGDTFASDLAIARNYENTNLLTPAKSSQRMLLVNTSSNRVIYSNGAYDKAYPASITKIMTAILAIEYGDMDASVTMQAADFALESGSQNSNMIPGDVVTLKQLVELMLVYSANDAANAIARTISGSEEAFVELMNEEAKSYGMTGTSFANAHGLHDDDHYTCAYDIYIMLVKAMDYSLFNETIRLSDYTLDVTRGESVVSYYYENTDEYLTGLQNAPAGITLWGGKTGTTSAAGSCLALIAQNENGEICIAVILNAAKKADLYSDMNAMLALAL